MKTLLKSAYTTVILCFLAQNISWAQKYGFHRHDSIIVTQNNDTLFNAWAGGMNSVQFSKIDLDLDGTEDLITFDRTGNKLMTYLFENNRWIHHSEFEPLFPNLHDWVLLRDYNCDGKKDIFTYTPGGISVWKNTSTTSLTFQLITNPYVYSNQFGNHVNLYVSSVDIPDISDIDGDGDLDVLTFGVLGTRVEYHRNLSMENGLGCDSLFFELRNNCWGHFAENGLQSNTCVLKDTCTNNVPSPEKSGLKHTGSVSLAMDLNADGTIDLLLGDVSYPNIVALTSDNKGPNMNTSFVTQDTLYPSYNVPAYVEVFPGLFYEDVDLDGTKDLIVSPNTDIDAKTHQSTWLYHNAGAENNPNFQFIEKNFIQNEMIEVGSNAYPVFLDYDNDGLQDLFISNFGFYDASQSDKYISQIYQYHNIGTAQQAEFVLVDSNFINIPGMGIEMAAYPTFGDIDNDTDIDMFVGDYNGNIHFIENTSSSPSVLNLSLNTFQIDDDNGSHIDIGAAAKPQLFDIDLDNDLDLIIGANDGTISYYENVGGTTNFLFRLQSSQWGGIDVSQWWTTIGSAVPHLFRNNLNKAQLFIGSEIGYIYHYDSIDNNLLGNFRQVDTMVAGIYIGPVSAPAVTDLNGDQIFDLMVGSKRGGLTFFKGDSLHYSSVNEIVKPEEIIIFPNPGSGIFSIKCNNLVSTTVYNISGECIGTYHKNMINLENQPAGIYIFRVQTDSSTYNQLVIKK